MSEFFINNLELVIFFYASALVILGFTILAQLRRTEISEFRLLDILWLLAWFGLAHGTHEFIDMFTVIKGENVLAILLSAVLSFISFLFLFAFGYRLFNISRKRIGPWLMVIAALGLVMLPIMFGPTSVIIWSISRRYFLAFPASVLIAIGFPLYYVTVVQALGLTRVKRYFFWAGFFFSAYAVIVGLVVAKANFFPASVINENSFFSVVGIPARVFRALVALGIAWSIWKIMDIFNIEQERERERSEKEREKLLHEIGERAKDLNCLYTTAKVAAVPNISLGELCQETAEIIPPSWQYPEITCARIIVHGQEYKTANFKKTKWLQTADIIEFGHKAGTVEVYYLEESPIFYEGPFLKEERDLIEGIAERLGSFTERKKAEEALRQKDRDIRKAYAEVFSAVTDEKLLILTPEEISTAPGEPKGEPYLVSSFEQLAGSRDFLRSALETRGLAKDDLNSLILASGEAVTNGVKHAGSCEVQVYSLDGTVQIRISDDGPGIDFSHLPKATLLPGFSTKKSLGMGFAVILDVCDRVLLSTGPEGTTLLLETGGKKRMDTLDDILARAA